METRTFLLLLLVLLVVVTIVGMPLITIWSLNTLFDTGIETTVKTWFAALLLASLFSGPTLFSKNN